MLGGSGDGCRLFVSSSVRGRLPLLSSRGERDTTVSLHPSGWIGQGGVPVPTAHTECGFGRGGHQVQA